MTALIYKFYVESYTGHFGDLDPTRHRYPSAVHVT